MARIKIKRIKPFYRGSVYAWDTVITGTNEAIKKYLERNRLRYHSATRPRNGKAYIAFRGISKY